MIFKNYLKLYERFLKNFENNTGRENPKPFSLLNLTFRLKLKAIKVPLYSWLQLRALVLEEINRWTWRVVLPPSHHWVRACGLLFKTLTLITKFCGFPLPYLWPNQNFSTLFMTVTAGTVGVNIICKGLRWWSCKWWSKKWLSLLLQNIPSGTYIQQAQLWGIIKR